MEKQTFTSLKSRHTAAILMTLLTATLIIPGMTSYLPFPIADKIGVPIFLFPFIWVGLFIYSYMARTHWHAWAWLILLASIHLVLSIISLTQ